METESNPPTGFDLLDDDSWALIMHHLTLANVIRMSQLCQRARSITLASPRLWREIRLSSRNPTLDKAAETILSRSKPHVLLDLTLQLAHPNMSERNRVLLRRFKDLASRTRHLSIRFEETDVSLKVAATMKLNEFLAVLRSAPSAVPNLATLELEATVIPEFLNPFPRGSVASITALRVANFDGAPRLFLNAAPWTNIRDLELVSPLGEDDLRNIVHVFPNVERLVVQEAASDAFNDQSWVAVPTLFRTPDGAGSQLVDVEIKYCRSYPVAEGTLRYLAGLKRFGVSLNAEMKISAAYAVLNLTVPRWRGPKARVHITISGSAKTHNHNLSRTSELQNPSRSNPMVVELVTLADAGLSRFIKTDRLPVALDVFTRIIETHPAPTMISLTLDGPDAIAALVAVARRGAWLLSQIDALDVMLERSEELDVVIEAVRKMNVVPHRIQLKVAAGYVHVTRSQLASLRQALPSAWSLPDVNLELGPGIVVIQ